MKQVEVITSNKAAIIDAMKSAYRAVLHADGRIAVQIYIWEDGELETLEDVQGSTSWLQARDAEPRRLYYVTTVDAGPCFDIWDASENGKPDDPDEAAALQDEITDWLMESYVESLPDLWDYIVTQAEYADEDDDEY